MSMKEIPLNTTTKFERMLWNACLNAKMMKKREIEEALGFDGDPEYQQIMKESLRAKHYKSN